MQMRLGTLALLAVITAGCEKAPRSAETQSPAPGAPAPPAIIPEPAPTEPAPTEPAGQAAPPAGLPPAPPQPATPPEPAPSKPATPRPAPPRPAPPKPAPPATPAPAPEGKACRSDGDCTIACIRAPCPTGVCTAGRCGITPAITGCMTMKCARGMQCVDGGTPKGRCVPLADEKAACKPTGCSGAVCADRDVITTCVMRPEYACYQGATCARQTEGECGWTPTPTLAKCLAEARDGAGQ